MGNTIPDRVAHELARLQLDTGKQHDEEHAEVGDAVEYRILVEPRDVW
jgi:hypothetical protein